MHWLPSRSAGACSPRPCIAACRGVQRALSCTACPQPHAVMLHTGGLPHPGQTPVLPLSCVLPPERLCFDVPSTFCGTLHVMCSLGPTEIRTAWINVHLH